MMELKELPTYVVRLYMAGDIDDAKRLVRGECYQTGLCVTIEPTSFIYTGGEESGFVIGFSAYPRFPSTPSTLFERASKIAESLIRILNQRTALLIATDKTVWLRSMPPGATE